MARSLRLSPCDVEVPGTSAKHVGSDLTLGIGVVALGPPALILGRAGAFEGGTMDSAAAR
jgi:hypothetical protein